MMRGNADRFAELLDGHPHARPDESTTPGMLSIVSALRGMDFDIAPDELTRVRQRQRLIAMAAVRTSGDPREQAVSAAVRSPAARPGIAAMLGAAFRAALRRARPGRHAIPGRSAIASVAALCLVVASAGALLLVSQNALPGDALYSLKRAAEQARLALAGSQQERGLELLGFASVRLAEIQELLEQPVALGAMETGIASAPGGPDADLLIDTLETMDRQTTEGMHAMASAAVDEVSVETLRLVGEWGVGQFVELSSLAEQMPGQAQLRAEGSKALLERAVQRLDDLAQGLDCACLHDLSNTDELGPIPCLPCEGPGSGGSSLPAETPLPAETAVPAETSVSVETPAPLPRTPGPTGLGPAPSSVPMPTIPPPTAAQPSSPSAPGPTSPPPTAPGPPAEGSQCLLGSEIGIIQGGICVPLPPPPTDPPGDGEPDPPADGTPCLLIDLPGTLLDVVGVLLNGVCVALDP